MTNPPSIISVKRQWLAVSSIAVASFSLVTAEFLPVGLLAGIAGDLGISTGTAGLAVAVPALVAAVAAPCLTIYAARRDRRSILLLLSALLVVSSLMSMYAPNWLFLLAARVVFGVALGGFWAIGASLPQRIMAPHAVGRATSLVYLGVSIGIVIGVPAGTLIGQHLGWRAAFAVAAGAAFLALLFQWFVLPKTPGSSKLTAAHLMQLAARPATMTALGVTTLAIGAQFATYTFVEPFLKAVTGADPSFVAITLAAYGVAGIVGSVAGGVGIDRSLPMTLLAVLLTTAAALALLSVFGHYSIAALSLIAAWGLAFGALPLCLQLWNARLAHPEVEAGAALFVGVLQASIAIGSAAGGLVVDHLGVRANMVAGALLFVLAAGLTLLARRRAIPGAAPAGETSSA